METEKTYETGPVPSLIRGPGGKFAGSTAEAALKEIPKPIESAGKYAAYQLSLKLNPKKARQLPENEYFGPEVTPVPDKWQHYDDPAFFRRNAQWEREGSFVRKLIHMGGQTIGEVQDLLLLYTNTLTMDDNCRVVPEEQYRRPLVKIAALTLTGSDKEREAEANASLKAMGEEVMYHRMVCRYLQIRPELVDEFVKDPEYRKLSDEFVNQHAAAYGTDPRTVGVAMLAGYYLLKFEHQRAAESNSQRMICNSDEYHARIERFVIRNKRVQQPPMPTGDKAHDLENIQVRLNRLMMSGRHDKTMSDENGSGDGALQEMANYWNSPLKHPEFDMAEMAVKFDEGLYNICVLPRLEAELHRHKAELAALNKIHELLPAFIVDDKGRRTLAQAIIGNMALARVETQAGPRFTASDWLPIGDGYTGPDRNKREVPEIQTIPTEVDSIDMRQVLKGIFSGDCYENQVARIYTAAPIILGYLVNNPDIPQALRETMLAVSDKNVFTERFMKRLGKIKDQDILIVNRFFSEGGVTEAQKFSAYRMVFDFVRGVETNLVLENGYSNGEKIKRRFGGKWKRYDFSNESDHKFDLAIAQTVNDGEHRVRMLNHVTEETEDKKTWTLKDWQEQLEIIFGWEVHDMKFVRWSKKWTVMNTALGVAVECICPMRKTIFNPRVFQQW